MPDIANLTGTELARNDEPQRNGSFGIPCPTCFKCNIPVEDIEQFNDPKYPGQIGLIARCHGEQEICFISEELRFLMSLGRGMAFMPKEISKDDKLL